jgi:hypothetical protein
MAEAVDEEQKNKRSDEGMVAGRYSKAKSGQA